VFTGQNNEGPSRGAVAWRRYLVELAVCLVLLGAIVAIGLEARSDILAGPAILALAGSIVAIVRHRWDDDP